MKRIFFIFILFAMALQVAFAQRGREVTIYFRNGNVAKGELTKLPNDERYRLQQPNGRIVLFYSNEVKDITYEDGTRPGASAPQQNQQRNPQQNQQAYPQQNQQRNPQQNQQAYPQQNQQRNNNQAVPQQGRQPVREETVDEYSDDYDDEMLYDEDGYEIPTNKKAAKKQATANEQATSEPPMFDITGPRGFIDFGYTTGMGSPQTKASRMEITASYGAQLNPSLFIGIGLGVHLYNDTVYHRFNSDASVLTPNDSSFTKMAIPIFADVRYNFSNGRFVPYVGLKLGYSIGIKTVLSKDTQPTNGVFVNRKETSASGLGFYIAPAFGVKYMMGSSLALNLSIGYTMQLFEYDYLDYTQNLHITKVEPMGGATFKVGVEF
jgi:hypothetical protein